MSSYTFKAKHRKTDEEVPVDAMDDYFGKHQYGYQVGNEVLNEEDFYKQYTVHNEVKEQGERCEQYKCPSYADDNNVIKDCLCGKCQTSCQCGECKIRPHFSDCAVHNQPSEEKGKCTCSSVAVDEKTSSKLLEEHKEKYFPFYFVAKNDTLKMDEYGKIIMNGEIIGKSEDIAEAFRMKEEHGRSRVLFKKKLANTPDCGHCGVSKYWIDKENLRCLPGFNHKFFPKPNPEAVSDWELIAANLAIDTWKNRAKGYARHSERVRETIESIVKFVEQKAIQRTREQVIKDFIAIARAESSPIHAQRTVDVIESYMMKKGLRFTNEDKELK